MTAPCAWPVRPFPGFSLCQFVLQVKRPGSLAQRARQFVDATRLSGKRAPSWRGFNDSLSPRVARASLALQGREILQEMAAPEWTPRCSASSSPLSPPCSPPHSPLGLQVIPGAAAVAPGWWAAPLHLQGPPHCIRSACSRPPSSSRSGPRGSLTCHELPPPSLRTSDRSVLWPLDSSSPLGTNSIRLDLHIILVLFLVLEFSRQ